MTDLQSWTLIGVFAATMFGVIGIVTSSLSRRMDAGFAHVTGVMDAKFEGVGYRFDALNTKIDAVEAGLNAKIDAVEARLGAQISALDNDVSAIAKRVFPGESG